MFIKRITVGLWGLAIAGILIMGCEKMDGPEPYLCKHLVQNQLLLISKADGVTPLGPAIQLESVEKLVITAVTFQAINIPEYANGLSIDMVGKIIFQ